MLIAISCKPPLPFTIFWDVINDENLFESAISINGFAPRSNL